MNNGEQTSKNNVTLTFNNQVFWFKKANFSFPRNEEVVTLLCFYCSVLKRKSRQPRFCLSASKKKKRINHFFVFDK